MSGKEMKLTIRDGLECLNVDKNGVTHSNQSFLLIIITSLKLNTKSKKTLKG
jgi:hypothetical protein